MTVKDWIVLAIAVITLGAMLVLCDILIAFIPYVILIVVRHEVAQTVADWIFFLLLVPEMVCLFFVAITFINKSSFDFVSILYSKKN